VGAAVAVERKGSNPCALVSPRARDTGIQGIFPLLNGIFHSFRKAFGSNNFVSLSASIAHFQILEESRTESEDASASDYHGGDGDDLIRQRCKTPFFSESSFFTYALTAFGGLLLFFGLL